MNLFKRALASTLIVCMATAGLPVVANAGIVSTEDAVSSQVSTDNRTKVENFLARSDVRDAMVAQGIDGSAAAERVKAMSDVEVAQLANRVDQAPAGGDVLGIFFTIFIVLLITDILGLTKVFPFTRSVR